MATQQVHEPAREGYFFMCVSRVLFIHLGVSNFPTHPRSPEPHTKRITDGFPPPLKQDFTLLCYPFGWDRKCNLSGLDARPSYA